MHRMAMCRTFVHRTISESPQKRVALEHNLASRALLWAGHVTRTAKSRLPKHPVLSLIPENPASPVAER